LEPNLYISNDFRDRLFNGEFDAMVDINHQSISTNHLHKNDQWLTNKVKNNKTKIKPNE